MSELESASTVNAADDDDAWTGSALAVPEGLSKNAAKRARTKARKAANLAAARKAAELYVQEKGLSFQAAEPAGAAAARGLGGKTGRARAFAANGQDVEAARAEVMETASREGPHPVVAYVEALEGDLRIKALPHLAHRRAIVADCHGTMEVTTVDGERTTTLHDADIGKEEGWRVVVDAPDDPTDMETASLRNRNLFAFDAPALVAVPRLATLLSLDASRNCMSALPGLAALPCLRILDIDRNWFEYLPESLPPRLVTLSAQHNCLLGSAAALRLKSLARLERLESLDVRFNKLANTEALYDEAASTLGVAVSIEMTVTVRRDGSSPPGAYEGFSPAQRDALQLRAQLEPWNTTHLRRRITSDFGRDQSDPATCGRSAVMEAVLSCYADEGLCDASGRASRKTVYVEGAEVPEPLRLLLLEELRAWRADQKPGSRERPTIKAKAYTILTSPAQFQAGSTKALRAVAKLRRHARLWELAVEAMKGVDPAFAAAFTALAVTSQFVGSPHIDKRNVGPFYGLALGDFADGPAKTGGICVEASARIVCYVDTANRLGKIDGRNPHWVAPYDAGRERFSLIYYQTAGPREPPGPCVFSVPRERRALT